MSTPALSPSTCSRCEAPLELGDLFCPVCLLAQEGQASVSEAAAVQATVIRCDGCGAAVTYSAEVQAPRCAFCASVMHLEQPLDPIEQAEAHLPFSLGREEATAALREWLGSQGFFRPSDLRSTATLASLTPVFFPAWQLEAECDATWVADTNDGAGRADWAPTSGSGVLRFSKLVLPASHGLSVAECMALIPDYDFSREQPQAATPSEGTVVERFEVQRSVARRRIIAALERQAHADVAQTLPGTRTRNLRVSMLLKGLQTRRFSLPAYVLAYRYRDQLFRVVVHGQNATCVIGTAPLSLWKIIGVVTLAVAALGVGIAVWLSMS